MWIGRTLCRQKARRVLRCNLSGVLKEYGRSHDYRLIGRRQLTFFERLSLKETREQLNCGAG
jgi:hypothetical protein